MDLLLLLSLSLLLLLLLWLLFVNGLLSEDERGASSCRYWHWREGRKIETKDVQRERLLMDGLLFWLLFLSSFSRANKTEKCFPLSLCCPVQPTQLNPTQPSQSTQPTNQRTNQPTTNQPHYAFRKQ